MHSSALRAMLSRFTPAAPSHKVYAIIIALMLVVVGTWFHWWWNHPYRNVGGHPQYVVRGNQALCLVNNIYHEARGESFEGQLLIAYVHRMRREADRRDWGGDTYCGVMSHARQFSWYGDRRKRFVEPSDKKAIETAIAVVNHAAAGWKPEGKLSRARYYLRTDHSGRRNVCWFKRELVLVGKVGNHEFYAEPTARERRKLAKQPIPAECKKEESKKGPAKT